MLDKSPSIFPRFILWVVGGIVPLAAVTIVAGAAVAVVSTVCVAIGWLP